MMGKQATCMATGGQQQKEISAVDEKNIVSRHLLLLPPSFAAV